MANKKKMNNVLTMWKQRSNEGQAPRVALDDNQLSSSIDEKSNSTSSVKNKFKNEGITAKENVVTSAGLTSAATQSPGLESQNRSGTLKGVIRSSGMGVVKSNTVYTGSEGTTPASPFSTPSAVSSSSTYPEFSTPFRTGASALGGYAPSSATGSGKRRFSEAPSASLANKEQSQTAYRDRAAERRSLYGSSSAFGEDESNAASGDSSKPFL